MINQLESNYDCSNAGNDLNQLQDELQSLQQASGSNADQDLQERRNRLENQISFIKNKCEIRP
ncbi:DUF2524 domain-containing protein [Paenibacillus allorhizosphaerae]|uniref:DUF2524 domain-containing protein n=1 Tax=Paenibacillus allorhizosphaerae TaxID=2849866 RepID=A0ABN7TQ29_9BACL|nr:DUF2524 domain-containing protein [Paenibacillus allorhizosphaerae]CAG7642067.1 hypothetical protein PAECIP111802_02811 [Paenibacillus allorhizosphaerae]